MKPMRFYTLIILGVFRFNKLTKQEKRVAIYYGKHGMTHSEISKMLFITNNTVKNTLLRIFRKMEVHSKDELSAALIGIRTKNEKSMRETVGR